MFAPRGNPCGLFTLGHLILFIITMLCVITLFIFTRNMKKETIKKISKYTAFIVLFLELTKMGYNFYYGELNLLHWMPISYCGTFIYAIFLASFGKGIFEKIGDSFVGVCFIAGFAFLVFPTTSITSVPAYHYLSIYSFLYHGVMLYFGLIYTKNILNKVDMKTFIYSGVLVTISTTIAVILNTIYDTNVMFVSKPPYIPITFIQDFLNAASNFITPIVYLVYMFGPFLCAYIYKRFVLKENN